MLANPNPIFETLINKLLIDKRYEEAMLRGQGAYQIKQFKVITLDPISITSMYYHISNKFYERQTSQEPESWYENELRVFIWLLMGHCYLEERDISKMKQDDWQLFSKVFNGRNPEIFQFQALSILKKQKKGKKWSIEQSSLLEEIINTKNIKNKWNQIARELFTLSGKIYFRTAKQCRQHWISHLDPSLLRTNWTLEEDLQLIQAVLLFGKKWSKISKKFGGRRTQHMVKNRYKSLIHFQLKKSTNSLPEEENQICEKKAGEHLLGALQKQMDIHKQLNFGIEREKFPQGQAIPQIELQSADKVRSVKKQYRCILDDQRVEENQEFDNCFYPQLNPFNEQVFSHQKSNKDDFSLLMHSEKDNPFVFQQCFSFFMNEDFKKDHFPSL